MKEEMFSGVIEDPRNDFEKGQDYSADEIASFSPVEWKDLEIGSWPMMPIKNQNGSGMCVAFATSTILDKENVLEEDVGIDSSALDIYDRRFGKPTAGMWFQNALEIASKYGACSGSQLPYQNLTETQANKPVERTEEMLATAKKYRAGGYVALPIDIDKIASIIQNGKDNKKSKGVLLGFRFNYDEWIDVPVILTSDPKLHHGVAGVFFGLWKGEKSIVIQDSWGENFAIKGYRIITESFLKARCSYAGYLLDLSNKQAEIGDKPRYYFTKPLNYGTMHNKDVVALQNILKYEGLFDITVPSTGNMLQITCKALKDWQIKHDIMDFYGIDDVRLVRFGPKSISLANKLYK